jgi:TonB family protein
MSTWVGSPAWTAAGSDRRPHVLQGLAVAAAVSLGAHLAAMSGVSPTLAGHDSPVVAHALAVRTIVLAPQTPVPPSVASLPAATAEATPAVLPPPAVQPPAAARDAERDRATDRSTGERRTRPTDAARAGDAAPAQSPPSRDATARSGPPPTSAAPAYLSSGQLDPPPRPLQDIEPVYPPEAGFQSGKVVLRLLIGETGSVDRVDVVRATPPGLFDAAARDAFAAARFSPGRLAGIAVKCEMTIEVDFTPINRGSEVSGRTY